MGERQWKNQGENGACSEPVTRISKKPFSGVLNCSGRRGRRDGRRGGRWPDEGVEVQCKMKKQKILLKRSSLAKLVRVYYLRKLR